MARKRLLLILGPSFRRNKSGELLPAIERYDGLFFRIARNYLDKVKNVDAVVMTDDLTLVDGKTPLRYRDAEGNVWGKREFTDETLANARTKNEMFLKDKLKIYSEVFVSMGKRYANGLPTLSQYDAKVIFPGNRIGPKAQALKKWLSEKC